MKELQLTLPWPPSVNHYKKAGRIIRTKSGRLYQQRVNTDKTKTFYFLVYQESRIQMPFEWAKFALSETISFEMEIDLHPPNKRLYDLDNRLKVLLDGLMHGHVIKDDSQITRLVVQKMDIIEHGKVIVRIREHLECT